jgi:hypothetical protein
VYGSDAVAGVVNVVLKKDFQGLEVSGNYGATTESGYDERSASLIWGFGDDDSNATMIFDYFKNSTLENQERGYLGTANQEPRGGQDLRSSRGFPGAFIVTAPDPANPGESLTAARVDPSCPLDRDTGTACIYDYGPWNLLIPEAERTGVMLLAHQGLGENIELFTELGMFGQHGLEVLVKLVGLLFVQVSASFLIAVQHTVHGRHSQLTVLFASNHANNAYKRKQTGKVLCSVFCWNEGR